MGGQPKRALLTAPEGMARRGVELLLTAYGVCVATAASDAQGAVGALRRAPVDVVLLDLELGAEAQRAVRLIGAAAPRLPILAYGGRGPWPLQELLDDGLRGFALTTCTPELFVQAVHTVASGASYLDPGFAVAPAGDPERSCRAALSERERQVLGLLAHGLNGREIAARLFLSPATVRTHVQNAMHKLGARTRAQAIALAAGEAE